MIKTIISRNDAKKAGLLRYFTGVACVNGHISERQVSSTNCLKCSAARKRDARAKNPETHLSNNRKYNNDNRDRINAKRRQRNKLSDKHRKESLKWYYENREKVLQRKRNHRAANKDQYNARQRARNAANPITNRHCAKLRQAAEKRAVPSWYSELDDFVWREATDLVAKRRVATGAEWHADHMIPIRAKTASGLHVWNNCQVIPAILNNEKKNKLYLTEPIEWVSYLN